MATDRARTFSALVRVYQRSAFPQTPEVVEIPVWKSALGAALTGAGTFFIGVLPMLALAPATTGILPSTVPLWVVLAYLVGVVALSHFTVMPAVDALLGIPREVPQG